MAVDFSTLVLAPSQDAFGLSITVIPKVSMPAQPSYTARGIWTSKPVIFDTGTGYQSTTQATLGIRLSEFPVPPHRDDIITVVDPLAPPDAVANWTIEDTKPDGQGKMDLVLVRRKQPL